MGATFSRVKNWTALENLTDTDLDAEFDNFITNFVPAGMDDYSASTAQMKLQTTPGALGTESLATSLAGELERIRFVLKRILGNTYWYEAPALSIDEIDTLVSLGNTIPDSRIISGRIRGSGSNQPVFLVPHGAAATVTLKGATTNFVASIDGTATTITTDITSTGLSLPASSTNTCLINDSTFTGQSWTKIVGEHNSTMNVDAMGASIGALVGTYQAFKVVHSASTEYFLAYVASSTTLTKVRRGYFFNSADAPIPRVVLSDNDVITLMKITWVFLKNDSTLDVTYANPIYSATTPPSPSSGDYWYDLSTSSWKRYASGAFTTAGAHLVGMCIQDSANCVGARSFEFFSVYYELNTVTPEYYAIDELRHVAHGAKIHVAGQLINYEHDFVKWIPSTQMDTGVTETSSTAYHLYITDAGKSIISDVIPYDRREDLYGYYHPYNPWRYVGSFFNNASSNATTTISLRGGGSAHLHDPGDYIDTSRTRVPAGTVSADGSAYDRNLLFRLWSETGVANGQGDNSTSFNVADSRARYRRGYVGFAAKNFATTDVDTGTEVLTITGHGINRSGFPVRFTTTTTLPTGLSLATTYYAIYVSADTIKVATTEANALAGTAINITTTGTGTHTISQYADPNASTRTAATTGGSTGDNVGSVQTELTNKNGFTLVDSGHTHSLGFYSGVGDAGGYLAFASYDTNTTSNLTLSGGLNNSTGITVTGGDQTTPANYGARVFIRV